jgi:hypothetical protein
MPFIPNARRTKEKTMPGVFEASGTLQAVLKMCAAYARARESLQTMPDKKARKNHAGRRVRHGGIP